MKMNSIKWLLMLVCLPLLTACGWEDLPAYEDADIVGVQFYYRWASSDKDPITGEPIVKEQRLGVQQSINADAGTVEVQISVPAANDNTGFTEQVRSEITGNPLWAQVTLSTAARLTPIGDSKPLGTPDNWSQGASHSYEVMAADGSKKTWTITVVGFVK